MKKLLIVLSIQIFTLSIFAQETDFQKLYEQGISLHDEGKYNEAINIYKKALRIDPNSSLVNYEISFSYFLAKDYKNAEKYSKKVIDLNDKHVLRGYTNYANALDMQGKPKKAIKVYEKAIKKFDNYLLYYNYAYTCFNQGEIEKAYEGAIKAIYNNSSHASSHLILSKIMDKKGSRIKAMLPLYFFLLIEPNSGRSAIEYQNLRNYIDQGVTRTDNNSIDVIVPISNNDDSDFGAAEMMVSLSKASNSMEENKSKTELQLFAENTDSLFKVLGELKKENKGFWWDIYVTFFYDLANENLTESYSYYISLSKGQEVIDWIDENNDNFEKFEHWLE